MGRFLRLELGTRQPIRKPTRRTDESYEALKKENSGHQLHHTTDYSLPVKKVNRHTLDIVAQDNSSCNASMRFRFFTVACKEKRSTVTLSV
jgi:hypothetical protein